MRDVFNEMIGYLKFMKNANQVDKADTYEHLRFILGLGNKSPWVTDDRLLEDPTANYKVFYKDYKKASDRSDFLEGFKIFASVNGEWYADKIAAYRANENYSYIDICLLKIYLISENGIDEKTLDKYAKCLEHSMPPKDLFSELNDDEILVNGLAYSLSILDEKDRKLFIDNIVKVKPTLALLLGKDYVTLKENEKGEPTQILVSNPTAFAVKDSAYLNRYYPRKIYKPQPQPNSESDNLETEQKQNM